MKMWIARDKCGILCIHREEPILIGTVWDSDDFWGIDYENYPEVTFENSPMEVELVDKNEFDSFVEIKEKYEDFLGIVAEMRHLQKEQNTAGADWNNTPYYKSLHKRMIELQEEVDRWLDLN